MRVLKVAAICAALVVALFVVFVIGEVAGVLSIITDPVNIFIAVLIASVMFVVCYVRGCSSYHLRTTEVAFQMPRPDGTPRRTQDRK